MRRDLAERSADMFLEHLADLAAGAGQSVRAECGAQILQRAEQFVRRFVKDHRTRLAAQFLQTGGAAFLDRQESFEDETLAGQPAGGQRRYESRGAGQTLHLHALPDSLTGQQKSGIGDTRGAGVGDQRHVLTGQDLFDDTIDCAVFVEHMMGLHRSVYPEVAHQLARSTGVFGHYQIRPPERFHCAGRHVVHISHRGGYQVQLCHVVRVVFGPLRPEGKRSVRF